MRTVDLMSTKQPLYHIYQFHSPKIVRLMQFLLILATVQSFT